MRLDVHRSEDIDDHRALDSLLDANFRETDAELVDRIRMKFMMGFGAVAVGVSTYLDNLVRSIYVWWRARRHGVVVPNWTYYSAYVEEPYRNRPATRSSKWNNWNRCGCSITCRCENAVGLRDFNALHFSSIAVNYF